jgi:hypothetical protein
MKATNKKSSQFTEKTLEFKGSNLKGVNEKDFYVVYSYDWWVLFAYDRFNNVWYENSERYSVSTSKQRSQCHPHSNTIQMTHQELKDLISIKRKEVA